jgi:hypothetical protein
MRKTGWIILFLLCSLQNFAQDSFSGTWEMKAMVDALQQPVLVRLRVGEGENNILFPAQLEIACGKFNGTYQLVLARKNVRQAYISKNKYPIAESPYQLSAPLQTATGYFFMSRDYKENSSAIRLNRFYTNWPEVTNKAYDTLPEPERKEAVALANWLQTANWQLKKTDPLPWTQPAQYGLLDPAFEAAYFGIKDSISVERKDGTLLVNRNKKATDDSLSVTLNGKPLLDQVTLTNKIEPAEFLLDTGKNILVVFADNYGKLPPNEGRIELDFAYRKWGLDFNANEDRDGSFMAVRLFYLDEKERLTKFRPYYSSAPLEKIVNRDSKLLGSIVSQSKEVTFALWDDALEDGDTISININNEWLVQQFPVLKKPQFLRVTLKPGPNAILFVANNLGSIPPNTAVLEIIDGQRRKSFMLDTSFDKNNLVRIFYDTGSTD